MKRELLELGSIGGQRSSWGHNEGKDFQISRNSKQVTSRSIEIKFNLPNNLKS